MKWSVLICLATPIAILVGCGIAAIVPSVADSLNNPGAHGFSELLYAYSSEGGNNGPAFAGFNANTVFLNISLWLIMLFVRFLPIAGTLAIAGSLAGKKKIDDGPGIPASAKDRIFDMFYTASSAGADSRRGLGLGLALCKSIINAHGGEITVADNSPKGTIFRFTLPAEEVTIHE